MEFSAKMASETVNRSMSYKTQHPSFAFIKELRADGLQEMIYHCTPITLSDFEV